MDLADKKKRKKKKGGFKNCATVESSGDFLSQLWLTLSFCPFPFC